MKKTLRSYQIDNRILNLINKMPANLGLKSKTAVIEKSVLYTCKALAPELYEEYQNGKTAENRSVAQLEDL